MQLREYFGIPASKLAQESRALSTELVSTRQGAMAYARESMMVALQLAMEDQSWIRTDAYSRDEFGTHLTFAAIKNAAIKGMALIQANPLMSTAADARVSYVQGNGVRITGNTTVTNIMDISQNHRTLFSEAARENLMLQKIGMGNVLVLVTRDVVEIIPFEEITGAVYDPDDGSKIQYFHRKWKEERTDFDTNVKTTIEQKMLYPNRDYDTGGRSYPGTIGGVDVYQQGVIVHISGKKYGGAWGVPDLLAGIFYATEHKELIEAADAIYRAQSQYAIQYKTKTRKAFEKMAAQVAAPAPTDPRTGEAAEYGGSAVFGDDIEMQLMGKIGAGIDFKNFDPIAALAVAGLGIPMDVALGREVASTDVPFTTLQRMKIEQRFWSDTYIDIFEQMGVKRSKVKVYWPKINPDPTHRQVQSIVGAAKSKVISPEETRALFRDTFGADWEDKVPDPSLWDDFTVEPLAPGAVEGPVTPGQGQTGQLGKLADGDHSLRDEGLQDHTKK